MSILDLTDTVVKTTVEQTGQFYKGQFYDAEGNEIYRTKDEQDFINALSYIQNIEGQWIGYEEYTIDVS